MIRLRAHHLLCCLTFTGKGYTAKFVENYHQIIRRLAENEMIELVSDPDDICAPVCSDPKHHCYEGGISDRDARVFEDLSRHTNLDIKVGSKVKPSEVFTSDYCQLFSTGRIRNGCAGCEWKTICDDVAENSFADSALVSSTKGCLFPK